MKNEKPKSIKLRIEASVVLEEEREAMQTFPGFAPLWIIFLV